MTEGRSNTMCANVWWAGRPEACWEIKAAAGGYELTANVGPFTWAWWSAVRPDLTRSIVSLASLAVLVLSPVDLLSGESRASILEPASELQDGA